MSSVDKSKGHQSKLRSSNQKETCLSISPFPRSVLCFSSHRASYFWVQGSHTAHVLAQYLRLVVVAGTSVEVCPGPPCLDLCRFRALSLCSFCVALNSALPDCLFLCFSAFVFPSSLLPCLYIPAALCLCAHVCCACTRKLKTDTSWEVTTHGGPEIAVCKRQKRIRGLC